ncbi:MAG: glycogen/starch synthase [Actinomycetota bacterium]
MTTAGRFPRVLFAVAEAYPFLKVGGLADVGGALPSLDVTLVLPHHPTMPEGAPVASLFVRMGRRAVPVRVCSLGRHAGVEVLTLGPLGPDLRDRPYAYQDEDVAAFILWSKAVVEFAATRPAVPDVIHCHDWHAGLVPHYAPRGPPPAPPPCSRSTTPRTRARSHPSTDS